MNNSPTVLEINTSAIKHNLEFFKSKINNSSQVLVVLKAYAYGNDAVMMANILEKQKVDYFAVAYTQEGVVLREAGIKTPIIVLHPQAAYLELAIKHNLEPNIYSKNFLTQFLSISRNNNLTNYPIHLKFNTGLNRLGFVNSDLPFIAKKIKEGNLVQVKSIFSHLAASEDKNMHDFTLNQIEKFKTIAQDFENIFGFKPMQHITNTSGILNYPQAHFDMVRLGIGVYGFANNKSVTNQLQNVATLKSVISQIHTIKKGESVGYNRAFFSDKEIKTATIAIGHADGISRNSGNGKWYVTINNQKALVIGNICMDMIMADVTNISCEEGDTVVIFENQDQILDFAKNTDTISYEVITSISQRVHRKLI